MQETRTSGSLLSTSSTRSNTSSMRSGVREGVAQTPRRGHAREEGGRTRARGGTGGGGGVTSREKKLGKSINERSARPYLIDAYINMLVLARQQPKAQI